MADVLVYDTGEDPNNAALISGPGIIITPSGPPNTKTIATDPMWPGDYNANGFSLFNLRSLQIGSGACSMMLAMDANCNLGFYDPAGNEVAWVTQQGDWFGRNGTFSGNLAVGGNTTLTGNLTVGGITTLGNTVVNGTFTIAGQPFNPANYVPVTRRVNAGAGLSGGGALSSDVTLTANVLSVFGRTGNVVAQNGDYNAGQITLSPSVGGWTTVQQAIAALQAASGSGVASLNGLTGAVTLAAGPNITLTPSGNTITISSPAQGLPTDPSFSTVTAGTVFTCNIVCPSGNMTIGGNVTVSGNLDASGLSIAGQPVGGGGGVANSAPRGDRVFLPGLKIMPTMQVGSGTNLTRPFYIGVDGWGPWTWQVWRTWLGPYQGQWGPPGSATLNENIGIGNGWYAYNYHSPLPSEPNYPNTDIYPAQIAVWGTCPQGSVTWVDT
jgi:hypothetical protein